MTDVKPNPLFRGVSPAPDTFEAPYQDYTDHGRNTPGDMGGAMPVPTLPVAEPAPRNIDPGIAALLRRMQNRETRALQFNCGGIATINVPTVCAFVEVPPLGVAWDMKAAIVGPGDFTSLPYDTGITTLIVARNPQQRTAPGTATLGITAADVIGMSTSWPAQIYWGRHEASAVYPEQIQAIVMGLATGRQITGYLQVEQTATDVAEIRSL